MEKILVDTNVIVKYLKDNDGILGDILGSYTLAVSVVTVTELLATSKAADKSKHKEILNFIMDNFQIIATSQEVAVHTAEIVRSLGMNFAESTIAAVAIIEDIPLLTYAVDDFDVVPDLKLIDI